MQVEFFGGPRDGEEVEVEPRDAGADIAAWLKRNPEIARGYAARRHWHGRYVLSWVGTPPMAHEEE